MSLAYALSLQFLSSIIITSQAHTIDYESYRNDIPPSLESVASRAPPIKNLLHELLAHPPTSTQQETEQLLAYAGLARLELLSKLGTEVYNDEELTLAQLTALNDIYQHVLERKIHLLYLLPLENSTVQHFCSQLHESPSTRTCKEISHEIHLTFPPAPGTINVTLSSILAELKSHQLELSNHLLLGMLLHVPFNSYDARTHNSLHHLVSWLMNSNQKIESGLEYRTHSRMVDLIRDVLASGVFAGANPHAQWLAEQLEETSPLNSNIEALGAILENDKINLKFLFDTVLPNDSLDQDLVDAKDYLRHKLETLEVWDINQLIGVEKYEYLKQDELLIGLLDKLVEVDFVKDIASALKVNAYFWHRSHMIENLNELLELFDNYNNLRGVADYRELMKTISRIKNILVNSNNVTIELMCTRPRACLMQGLIKIKQCRGINQETKTLINNFLEQSRDCSQCNVKCEQHVDEENDKDRISPGEEADGGKTEECNSEECEDDEVKAALSEDNELKELKMKEAGELDEKEEQTTTEAATEISLAAMSVEETTRHVEAPTTQATTTTPTTEATTVIPTTEPTTRVPTTEPTTRVPTTEPTTRVPTTEPTTTVPTTEPTTEQPTTEAITEHLTTELTTAAPTTVVWTEPPTTEATTRLSTTEATTERITKPTEKNEWVDISLKEITVPSVSEDLHKDADKLETTEPTVRTTVKMMTPGLAKIGLWELTTAAPLKRKRIVCHHRDLYHRKKLRKLNKYKKHGKHQTHDAEGAHLGLGKVHSHSHLGSGELDIHVSTGSEAVNEHSSEIGIGHSAGKIEVHVGGKEHSEGKHGAHLHSNHAGEKVEGYEEEEEGKLGAHSYSEHGKGSEHASESALHGAGHGKEKVEVHVGEGEHSEGNHDAHLHSNHAGGLVEKNEEDEEHSGGKVGAHLYSNHGKADEHSSDSALHDAGHANVKVGVHVGDAEQSEGEHGAHLHSNHGSGHADGEGGKVDVHLHSHSDNLGLHSQSGSEKVDMHSQSNSSELGVHSHSNSDSASEKDRSSLMDKTKEKLKAGIDKLNPFGHQSKKLNAKLNFGHARKSGRGFESSEELGSSDSSGSDLSDGESEHKYFEDMKRKKKKSKAVSEFKDSQTGHKSHKKMTSYYNEEFKEEKVKKHRTKHVSSKHVQHRHSGKVSDVEQRGNSTWTEGMKKHRPKLSGMEGKEGHSESKGGAKERTRRNLSRFMKRAALGEVEIKF